MRRRLDRYIFTEILGPLGLGFTVYTLILLLNVLFKSAEMIIRRGVPASTVGELLLLSLPSVVVLTIPMSLLFAILIAVGRLSSDSELTALRSCGISLFSLYRPILFLAALLGGLNLYLMLEVLPDGNHALQRLRAEIFQQSLARQVEPRVFYSEWEDTTLYIFETPLGDDRWKGTLLLDSVPGIENQTITADWGRALADESGAVVLSLENAYQHQVDLADPRDYSVSFHNEFDLRVATPDRDRAVGSVSRNTRELTVPELRQRAADASLPEFERRRAAIEVHKKFSIPAVCLVFALLGLPLGFSNKRGGRSSGFVMSIGVILIYHVLLSWGEEVATNDRFPPSLAMWLPNVVLLALAFYLLARRNRDKSLLLSRIDRWVQEHLWTRMLRFQHRRRERKLARRHAITAARRARADLVLRLPRFELTFPSAMDRYILGAFLRILGLAALSGLAVYLIADLTEKVDNIMSNQVPWDRVWDYYKYKSLAIVYEIAPVIILVTTLTTFALLSRNNEVTAAKALGLSLYRLAVPVVLAAAVLALLFGLLESEVLAASNTRVAQLEDQIMGRDKGPDVGRRADRRWLFSRDGYLYNYLHYASDEKRLQRLQVFGFDENHRLSSRLLVNQAVYAEDGWWTFSDGWARTFDGNQETSFRSFDEPRKERLPIEPDFFSSVLRQPNEMRYGELKTYITELQTAGQQVPQLEVELHNKIAYPAISLVMALVALPFAFRLGRRGALYGIGVSIFLGIIFLALMAVFSALGETAVLPPLVAVWSPSLIFATFSMYLFLGVKT